MEVSDIIKKAVVRYHDLPEEIAFGKSRKREIVEVRQIAQYFIREKTNLSLAEIGRITGGFNHATVLTSGKVIKGLLEVSKTFKEKKEAIEDIIDKELAVLLKIDMKIYEFRINGDREWICAKTIFEAIEYYTDDLNISYHDICGKLNDIVELPQREWRDYKIYDPKAPKLLDGKPSIIESFYDFMIRVKEPNILATTNIRA